MHGDTLNTMQQVHSINELMGVDILKNVPHPTHPSEIGDWYDSRDPVPSDEVYISTYVYMYIYIYTNHVTQCLLTKYKYR